MIFRVTSRQRGVRPVRLVRMLGSVLCNTAFLDRGLDHPCVLAVV